MPKFAANLSFLYGEYDFLDRFGLAARDGFRAVEYMAPYVADKAAIAERLARHGLTQALFNLPAGDWDAGERGIASLPGRGDEFRAGVATAIDYARALNCKKINCLAGIPNGIDPALAEATLVDNLKYAAAALDAAGILLVMEPINTRDMPGYCVATTDHAERVLDQVGSDNLKIQYDLYHMQVMQGDLVPTFERLRHRIGHIQIADTPGRNEPGTGEINYGFVLNALDRLGYTGWVGCEYRPRAGTSAGLGWMRPFV